MGEPKKVKKKSGNSSIRSPSSEKRGPSGKEDTSSTASGPPSPQLLTPEICDFVGGRLCRERKRVVGEGCGTAVKGKKKSGTSARKYTDSEKLSVCILYEFLKSTDRVAEASGMEGSSVRYIVKNNKTLREKAKDIVLDGCLAEAEEFAGRLRETAQKAIEKLLAAIVDDTAIGKSNSQQLAIAMATLMDKFSLMPAGEEKKESGGVIILPEVEKG